MTAGTAGSGGPAARPVAFLPGPVPDRETLEGWTRWRLTRRDFVPAPVITAADHAAMTPRQRRLHDLHRVATHSNLAIQETPMSAFVSRTMRSLIETNAFCRGPDTRPGLMINGGACQGKTETACEALACYEDEWLALYARNPDAVAGTLDLHVPAVYVRTPVKATPISLCQRILHFYGEPYKGMRLEDLIRAVKDAVFDHGTKAIVIDDVTRLKLHREADQDVLDLIRELMSLPATLILVGVGIPKSGLLRDGRKDPETGQWIFPPVPDRGKSRNDDAPGQTDLRFELVDLDRFSYAGPDGPAAWTTHLVGIEQQLRLLSDCDGMLSGSGMPEYLFGRTDGIVGLLKKLIQAGCRQAIETGTETITAGLLDALTVSPADLPDSAPMRARSPAFPRHPPALPGNGASRGTLSSTTGAPPPTGPRADRAMPQSRPLPRSLVPLPGESLPGFILRLSFRLNQPPARIAELTGLAPDRPSWARMPVILLAGIPEADSSTFARMTRLTGAQAARLGMGTWRERYPPVIASPESKARGARRLDGRLVLAPATRYCPECLAGDGSAVQESFGGPWLKAWHLPVVFACPVHQRLLEHLCPECGQAVRERRHGSALLPAMLASGLHPAQCRTQITPDRRRHPACCGARLDQDSRRRPASPGLAALQNKILGLLDPGGPAATLSAGMPAPPASYFSDLRALALLACSTWPAARHLSPDEDAASAIDQHIDSLRKQAAARHAGTPPDASRTRLDFSFPPADAAASGGLTHIADRILAGTRDDVREQLLLLLPFGTRSAGQSRWGLSMTRMAIQCSEGLQAAYAPVLRTFTKTGGPRSRRDAVLRPGRWGLENIPAFLTEDWYARHFMPIAGVSDRFIRRTAALRLVQMVAGGSLHDAAQHLGIASAGTAWPGYGIYAGAGHVHSGARKQHGPLAFENALEALARELDHLATPLVNYQSRRQALQAWCIDKDTWISLTARLPPGPGPQQPDLGDRKRQLASIYVWVQVTSGEHLFAPRPIEAIMPPSLRKPWTQWTSAWKLLDPGHPGPHYTSLKAELDRLATSLALAIDTAAQASESD